MGLNEGEGLAALGFDNDLVESGALSGISAPQM